MADFHFIDRLTQTYIDKGYFPSAVVSVFDSHKTLYRKAYGDNPAQGGKGRAKVDTYTAYDMASCTKIADRPGKTKPGYEDTGHPDRYPQS